MDFLGFVPRVGNPWQSIVSSAVIAWGALQSMLPTFLLGRISLAYANLSWMFSAWHYPSLGQAFRSASTTSQRLYLDFIPLWNQNPRTLSQTVPKESVLGQWNTTVSRLYSRSICEGKCTSNPELSCWRAASWFPPLSVTFGVFVPATCPTKGS